MSAWQRGGKETSWQSRAYGDISTLIECTASENIFRYHGGAPGIARRVTKFLTNFGWTCQVFIKTGARV